MSVAGSALNVTAATINPLEIFGGVDRYAHVTEGFRNLTDAIWQNMDGPVAYGQFKIERPLEFLADPESLVEQQRRCKKMTGKSDYELWVLAKPLPTDDANILPPAEVLESGAA
jgi:hypothetical protein